MTETAPSEPAGSAKPLSAPDSALLRGTGLVALAAAITAIAALAAHTVTSRDVGYHLFYGENPIVDSARGLIEPQRAADAPPPPAGPGAWYDAGGRYRFANCNWLFQWAAYGAFALGGWTGVAALRVLLAMAIAAAAALWTRRLGGRSTAAAMALLLLGVTGYERLLARPELAGYVILAVQLALLVPPCRLSRGRVAALAGLQILAANVHSYFLLAPLVALAATADAAFGRKSSRGQFRLHAAATGAMLAACLVNPWTWRGAILPLQTLWVLWDGGGGLTAIHELRPPLDAAFRGSAASMGFVACLVVGGLGAASAAARRRWTALAVIGLGIAAGGAARRNLLLAAVLIAPVATAEIAASLRWLAGRLPQIRLRGGGLLAAAALLGGGALTAAAASGWWLENNRLPGRPGFSLEELSMPGGAARWLANLPGGESEGGRPLRVWCDFNCSSNLLWLTHLRGRELRLPVLTNTFAVPPSRLEGVLAVCRGKADFDALRRTQRPEAVVLELSSAAAPLARRLLRQADWTLVHLDATHAGFLPRRTATAQGAVPIRQEMLSVPRLLESARKRAGDDARSAAMRVGRSLFFLGWITAAGDAFVAAVEADPREAAGWNLLGVCRAREGVELLNAGDWRGRRKLLQAAQAYRRTLELRPEFPPARRSLRAVEKILSDLETGVVPPPAEPSETGR